MKNENEPPVSSFFKFLTAKWDVTSDGLTYKLSWFSSCSRDCLNRLSLVQTPCTVVSINLLPHNVSNTVKNWRVQASITACHCFLLNKGKWRRLAIDYFINFLSLWGYFCIWEWLGRSVRPREVWKVCPLHTRMVWDRQHLLVKHSWEIIDHANIFFALNWNIQRSKRMSKIQ